MSVGKVWLVGAGPGDAGLLTIKGLKALEQAETVVYDRLVGKGILLMIPENAKLIDVGKTAGNHTMPQEDINKVLLSEAIKGKRVVRLKGGDPFLFGRGGEELELLVKNHIPFEIVPGITSAISVPAYNGIPVTHRDFTSSLHIITGHKKQGEEYDIDFKALVDTRGTLVFLMGVSALGDICRGLLDVGIDKDMPAAILEKGTTAKQRRIVATISTLEEEVKKKGIGTPGIIVVGKVCTLSEEFYWFEKLPLSGCNILVTRPKDLISKISERLREKGASVLELPTIKVKPIENNTRLEESIEHIDKYNWLVFTSPSGVDIFLEIMKQQKVDIRKLSGLKIAAVGQGTAKKIEEHGMNVDLIPEETYDGKTLGIALNKKCKDGDRFLIPRAKIGTNELIEELQKNKVMEVDDIPIYDTFYEESTIINIGEEFDSGNIDFVVFTSSSSVKGFVNVVKKADYTNINAICIGKQTKDIADSFGMKTTMSKMATLDSLIEKVEEEAKELHRRYDND